MSVTSVPFLEPTAQHGIKEMRKMYAQLCKWDCAADQSCYRIPAKLSIVCALRLRCQSIRCVFLRLIFGVNKIHFWKFSSFVFLTSSSTGSMSISSAPPPMPYGARNLLLGEVAPSPPLDVSLGRLKLLSVSLKRLILYGISLILFC